jgi:murein DD-endopeptidase MepM/ murein hydrolase activator NlpD
MQGAIITLKTVSILTVFLFASCTNTDSMDSKLPKPIRTVVDLDIGEERRVELSDGTSAVVELLEMACERDAFLSAVRKATVKVKVNGELITLNSGNYNLPVKISGVRIDCPVTGDYYQGSGQDSWGLEKDARLRLWPAQGPLIQPDRFVYPAGQAWFANETQMSNEPVYVNGCDNPEAENIYYHSGLDIGGCEGFTEVLSATDGLVIQRGEDTMPGYEDYIQPRYDVIYILDDYGWVYRYSHLANFAPEVKPGLRVKKGRKIGFIGKEGTAGGWAHLHFEIKCRQPSGKLGTEEGYAYLWESYIRQHEPPLLAVARPHIVAGAGDTVTLDGNKSCSMGGRIVAYDWSFSDGTSAAGVLQKRTYSLPGEYSEVLKITDSRGNLDYDYVSVLVLDKKDTLQPLPAIHASFYPTFGIKPGDPVTFQVRSFNIDVGGETWDFGDGSPEVEVESKPGYLWFHSQYDGVDIKTNEHEKMGYAQTTHSFAEPGDYLVRVENTNKKGYKAVTCLHVRVEL